MAKLLVKHILLVSIVMFSFSQLLYAGDAEEAQKQGLTIQEYKSLQGKKWNSSISTGYFRGIDEFAESMMFTGLNSSYNFGDNWIVGVGLEYEVPTDLEADNPRDYGLGDGELYITKPNFGKTRGGLRVGFSNALTLPTSHATQKLGLIASNVTSFSVTKQPLTMPRVTLIGSASLVLSHFRFKEDISGEVVFSPFGIAAGGTARLMLLNNLYWSNSYSVYNTIDYEGRTKVIQTLSTGLSFIATEKLSVSVSYRWKDRYVTNDLFLDDDKSRTKIGVSYLF